MSDDDDPTGPLVWRWGSSSRDTRGFRLRSAPSPWGSASLIGQVQPMCWEGGCFSLPSFVIVWEMRPWMRTPRVHRLCMFMPSTGTPQPARSPRRAVIDEVWPEERAFQVWKRTTAVCCALMGKPGKRVFVEDGLGCGGGIAVRLVGGISTAVGGIDPRRG